MQPSSNKMVDESYALLKGERFVTIFPALAFIFSSIVLLAFTVPFYVLEKSLGTELATLFSDMGQATHGLSRKGKELKETALMMQFLWQHKDILFALFCSYFFITFCTVFFNCCVVAATTLALDGKTPTISGALHLTLQRIPQILGWSLFSATVGLLLSLIRQEVEEVGGGLAARAGTAVVDVSWKLASLMVIPVVVIEGYGPFQALKASQQLFRKTWVAQLVGGIRIGFVLGLLVAASMFFFGVSLAFPLSLFTHVLLACLCAAFFIYASCRISALKLVFRTVVYHHLNDDEASPEGTQPAHAHADASSLLFK